MFFFIISCVAGSFKAWTHDATLLAILLAMAKLHNVSTPEIVARNSACNIAAVESRSTSEILRATNFIVKHVARNVASCVRAFTALVSLARMIAKCVSGGEVVGRYFTTLT